MDDEHINAPVRKHARDKMLYQLREEHNWKLESLAKVFGVSEPRISQIVMREKNKRVDNDN